MKYLSISVSLICLIFVAVCLAETSDKTPATTSPNQKYTYPIAPGIWYPGDGAIPDKPMRYYRVRCWPGCHSGSTLGKYPDKTLNDKPVFPTSTVPGHPPITQKAK